MKATVLAVFAALLALNPSAAPAQEGDLTQEEQAEKEARRACEAKICDVIASMDPMGEDISCDLVKTWHEDDIVEALGGRINWPWGKVECHAKIELPRLPLAKAMSEAAYEMTMPTQTAYCALSQKEGGDPYVVEIAAAPKVKFKNGKAAEAKVNWGEVSAPMMIYPLIYAGTVLDNSSNALGPEMVRLVNEFTAKTCAHVRADLPHRARN